MPFKQMENISQFLGACEKLGLRSYDMFQTIDCNNCLLVYENKNMLAVLVCITSFSRHAFEKGLVKTKI